MLRQSQFRMLGNNDLPPLALIPIENTKHLVNSRIRINSQSAVVDYEE